MVVIRILEGGAAHKTRKLLKGDVIVSIDGIVTRGWDLAKVCVRAGGL
jgi:C-terminal processing protease CtpA/Prc